MDGEFRKYYLNGNIESLGIQKGKSPEEIKKTGCWKYYYENGNKKEEGSWGIGGKHNKNNVQIGLWKYYNEEGELIKTIEFNDLGEVKVD